MNYEEVEEILGASPREELLEALEKGDLSKYTPEQIEEGMLQEDKYKRNLYHWAAQSGHLNQIPKELLTAESLLKPDARGHNCLHWAAYNGHLDQIPKDLLTKENLLQGDKQHKNCLYWAAVRGTLHQIPLLSHQTLRELETHFEKDSSDYQNEILTLIRKQSQKLRKAGLYKTLKTCDHPEL